MYVFLVNDDNELIATQKQRIMQKSKLVDELWFLVKPIYNGYDMSKSTVTLLYCLPESKRAISETLVKSDELHGEFLKYVLPFDTSLTREKGDIEIRLIFALADLDENGRPIQRVRKTDNAVIPITPTDAWSSIIPDSALDAIDQRIIKQDAQIKELEEISRMYYDAKADGLRYNNGNKELQLLSGGKAIGNKVIIVPSSDDGSDSDDYPVVEF